jgi:viologen exporter family transport system permease protein
MTYYLRIWLASVRYSVVRTLMFRGDFFVWSLVELFWMSVNLMLIEVMYSHTGSIAGWGKYEMILLVGTSLLIQRFLMGFFWSSIFELGRNVRNGNFDFFLAQPGHVMFMATTRKLDPDSLANSVVAMGVVTYAARHIPGLHVTPLGLVLYAGMIVCGVIIHYSILIITMSLSFWMTSSQGFEGSYFTLTEFSRLPSKAFLRFPVLNILFVWILPVVVVTNAPANTFLHGIAQNWNWLLGLLAATAGWFAFALLVFHRGLRRYASASS